MARAKANGDTAIRLPAGTMGLGGPMTYMGLVPDGVARVRSGSGPDGPTAEVHDNFFTLKVPQAGPPDLHWLGADGRVVFGGP